MASPSSPVSPEVVRKVAALARLSVPEADLPVWSEQLGRIVSYIDQLKELPEEGIDGADVAATPLRPDEPVAGEGLRALEQNARLAHGHGEVPRVVGGGATPGAEGYQTPPARGPASGRGFKDTDAG